MTDKEKAPEEEVKAPALVLLKIKTQMVGMKDFGEGQGLEMLRSVTMAAPDRGRLFAMEATEASLKDFYLDFTMVMTTDYRWLVDDPAGAGVVLQLEELKARGIEQGTEADWLAADPVEDPVEKMEEEMKARIKEMSRLSDTSS